MIEKALWGIHAGKTGDADKLFLEKKVIAIGWDKMGDLSNLKTREEFKECYAQTYQVSNPPKIATSAGQPYRFVHEVQVGDLVVYPSKSNHEVHIGEITGKYTYRPSVSSGYPNQRDVKWLKKFPRTRFTQGALYEIGSAMSLFQVKNYADEFREALEGKTSEHPTTDTTIALVTADIEEQTRDFVIKQLSTNLKGTPLEDFVAHLLEKMGYKARLSRVNEPSVDIIAHRDELGFEPPIIKVQVKSSDGKIGDKDVSALYGKVENGEHGLMVALGEFTPKAHQFANSKSNLRLLDGSDLVSLVFEYYEQFDSKYKGLLPLKKVYVPEVLEQDE